MVRKEAKEEMSARRKRGCKGKENDEQVRERVACAKRKEACNSVLSFAGYALPPLTRGQSAMCQRRVIRITAGCY